MILNLVPIASQKDSMLSISGSILTINGQPWDLAELAAAQGTDVDPDHPFIGPVIWEDGQYHCKVLYHYDSNTAKDHQPFDPVKYIVEQDHGPVPDPIVRL